MFKYRFGHVLMIAHVAAADIAAGDLVDVNGVQCIAHQPIAQGKQGSLAYPTGTAVYEVAKKTGAGEGFAFGEDVFADTANSRVQDDSAGDTLDKVGVAVTGPNGAVAGDNDTTMRFLHTV